MWTARIRQVFGSNVQLAREDVKPRVVPCNAICISLFVHILRLGLGLVRVIKKEARPARVAEAGQENIKTVHEPKPIQASRHPL